MKIAKEYTTDAFTGRMVRPGEFYTQKAAQQQSQAEEKQKTQEKEVEQQSQEEEKQKTQEKEVEQKQDEQTQQQPKKASKAKEV